MAKRKKKKLIQKG
ncbi:unnamed protein product, partial [Vitis vinifera]